MTTDYSNILSEYPEKISIEQLYRICHFSKRKCKWLLENGYIPCEDRGTKTWRFVIRTVDVVEYLTLLETDANRVPPTGIFSNVPVRQRATALLERVPDENIRSFLRERWSDKPDALTVCGASQLTGYSMAIIRSWITEQRLKYVLVLNEIIIPKDWLIECYSEVMKKCYSEMPKELRALVQELIKRERRREVIFPAQPDYNN